MHIDEGFRKILTSIKILTMECQCHSGLPYLECCAEYHTGKQLPESAMVLMRSRFSAYARKVPDYIMKTTHPENPSYSRDKDEWRQSIIDFCQHTEFRGLKIIEFVEGENEAFVTFHAHLIDRGKDISFIENSRFLKVGDQWLYHSGHVEPQ